MKAKASAWLMSAALVWSVATTANAAVLVMDDTSGNNLTAVQGTMDYSVSSLGSNSYLFAFTLENTSALGTTRLTGVALDLLAGSAVTANTNPAGWGFDGASPTLPGEAASFDVCWYSGSNCGAGGNGGLDETDAALSGFSVTFTLAGYGDNAAAVQTAFSTGFADGSLNACVRVISIPERGAGSGNGAGSDVACAGDGNGGGGGGGGSVPEPAPIALMGLGFAGMALLRRRIRAAKAA